VKISIARSAEYCKDIELNIVNVYVCDGMSEFLPAATRNCGCQPALPGLPARLGAACYSCAARRSCWAPELIGVIECLVPWERVERAATGPGGMRLEASWAVDHVDSGITQERDAALEGRV
jgi:hypothetical protein